MARKVIHRKASSSWWNGTITALCGLTVPRSEAVTTWFASVNCLGCRAGIKAGGRK